MKKTLAFILAATLALSAALSGCGSKKDGDTATTPGESGTAAVIETKGMKSSEAKGKVLKWNVGDDLKTMDPTLVSATNAAHVINNTFEGLMRDKADGKGPQPAMAAGAPEEKTNEDGTITLTYKLIDAKWSDGQPVTAQNFEFAWKRCADPKTASDYGYIMGPIIGYDEISTGAKAPSELGVKAIDDKTLEVILKQPTGYFNDLLGMSAYMPLREDLVGTDVDGLWAKDPAKAVSNGPFNLVGYTMGKELVFEKNKNYWSADTVKIDYITARMIVDEGTALTAFQNGDLYIADNAVSNEETQQLVAANKMQIVPNISTSFYVVNVNTEDKALQDSKVRQALSMAIDRNAIVTNVTGAGEKAAMGFIPYGFMDADGKDFRETAGGYYLKETADVEGAKKLLEEAGFSNGEGLPEIELLYNTNENLKAVCEAIQEMWKAIGVTAKLSNQEWPVFQSTRNNLQYKDIARHGWTGDYMDPQTFLEMFITGNAQSGCGYTNPDFDKAMMTAMATTGKERYDAFYEAEKVLMNDAFVLPIYFSVNKVLVDNEKVTGWTLSPTGKFWFGDAEVLA